MHENGSGLGYTCFFDIVIWFRWVAAPSAH